MIQKIKQEFKKIFTSPKEIISFLLPIIVAIILLIPLPYTITIGGGTMNIDNKILVSSSYKSKGTLNSAYVKEVKGTIGSYFLAKIIPNYKIEKNEDIILNNENIDDYNFRERMYFNTSLDSAVLLAYKKANKNITVTSNNLFIVYIDDNAKTNLKIQDKILKVNNKSVNTYDDFIKEIKSFNVGDTINITVLRNNKEIACTASMVKIDGQTKIGLYIMNDKQYNSETNIDFKFTNRENGPSGGLMITLSIYNKLIEKDITKGYKIVGTGTIDENGNVGEIGGVKYKLQGAVHSNADVFLCPKENYAEALKEKEDKKYNIKIISVFTFDQALEVLDNL